MSTYQKADGEVTKLASSILNKFESHHPLIEEAIVNLELLLRSAIWPPEMKKEGAREMAAIVLAVLKESVKV